MANDIALTSGMRSNLVSLQQTTTLLSQTQQRLATGRKVNSALDNPASFFAASAHTTRANLLSNRKDGISEAIQTIKAADAGVTSLNTLLETARCILEQARSAATANRSSLSTQYNNVMTQITNTVTDSKYKGINLLDNGSLTVQFNEDNSTNATVSGFSAGIGGSQVTVNTNDLQSFGASTATSSSLSSSLDTIESKINTSISNLNTQSGGLAANLSILQARNDFLTSVVNNEQTGADNLTLADTNQEGANMLALQTRQQLGVTSLSLASQAAQSVLRLF